MGPFITQLINLLLLVAFLVVAYFSLKKFWVLFSVNIFILILYAVSGVIDGYRSLDALFLLFACGAFLVLFNIVAILQFWEDYGLLTLLLLFVSILGFWLPGLAIKVGRDIRVKVFENRLDLYEAAVKELTPMIDGNGLTLYTDQIPQRYKKLAYRISAEKKEGIVFIFGWQKEFIFSKHAAFAYYSDDFLAKKGAEFRCEPPYCERISKNWFRVGN